MNVITEELYVEDLGAMVHASFGQGAAIRHEQGTSSICFISNGSPAVFYEFELFSGKLLFSQALPPIDCVWGICCTPEGEVYFSGTIDSILYRYRTTGQLEQLGENPSNPWVINLVPDEQCIWGGTYPQSKLFSYDRQTGQYQDYGTILEGQDYLRGIVRDEDWLYLSTGSTKYLMRYNLRTQVKEEIMLEKLSHTSGFLDRLWIVDRFLFVASDFIHMYVYDLDTYELIDQFDFDNLMLVTHPKDAKLLLYKAGDTLCAWHKELRTSVTIIDSGLPTGRCKALEWVKYENEDYIALVTVNAEQAIIRLSDLSIMRSMLKIEPQSLLLTCFEVSPDDGCLYIGGYHRGMTKYDPVSQKIDWTIGLFPQTEGMTFHDGQVYFGTYTHAHLYRYDPQKQLHFDWFKGSNPDWIGQIEHKQDRPFTMIAGDRYVFSGTVPDYGRHGGALAVWDTEAETLETFPQVVENQSILGLAYWNGYVFGSSSVWGGLGNPPVEGPAKIFVWDVENKRKIAEFVPHIPDAVQQPLMIGELSLGPDGLIWGADDGTLFAIDPETYQVVKSKVVYPTAYAYSKWRPICVRWGKNGLLYTTLARRITILDPHTLEHRTFTDDIVGHIAIDAEHRIYFNRSNKLFRLTLPDNLFK
ncbi:hypothetical protein [Paenibacillus marinisediminis]